MKPLVLTYWLCKLRIKGFRSREGQLWMCQSMSLMSTTMRQNSSICNLMWKNLKIFWLASRTMQRYVFFSPSFLSFTLYFLRRLALKAQDFLSLNVLKEFYQNIWIRSCCVNYLYSYLYIRHGKNVFVKIFRSWVPSSQQTVSFSEDISGASTTVRFGRKPMMHFGLN